ncbi:serine/threonine-protein kinase [Rhizohabitans arisaemae]|uniref:serine/threonine-protein kinase n=1 Tax=Rhizohabitans arisaemae TaxID=2720610 RepID=UPI0024B20B20|nr:serine/threonine-protein kinase [Rhizohabitans arisaemae]
MPETTPLRSGDPRQIGGFQLTGRLGEGGQGVVYLGHGATGEPVAIKVLHVRFTGNAAARSRFGREAAAATRVASFCTASVLKADLDGDTPYIVSEYIEASSLRAVVEEEGPIGGARLQRIAVGTATALTAIHHAGIVHRDFKPDNVLLATDGPRVVDFGIARILDSTGTITSVALGTPAYMAPEQIANQEIGPKTDVFAWGATIVYAATGAVPFAGPSIAVVLNRILNEDPDFGELPDPLRDLVAACLSKSPGDRPTSDEVLLRLLGGKPAPAPTRTEVVGADDRLTEVEGVPTQTVRRRGRARLAGIALAAVVAVPLAVYGVTRLAPGEAGTAGPTPSVSPPVSPPVTPSAGPYESIVDKARETGRLVIGIKSDLPGVALYRNQPGEVPEGYEVEVAKYIAGKLGVSPDKITFRRVSALNRLALLVSGKVDMVLATHTIPNGPSPKALFAGPYYLAHRRILVRQSSPVRSMNDLTGKKLCAPQGAVSVAEVRDRVSMEVVPVTDTAICMDKLGSGEVDAVPGDDLILAGFAARGPGRYRILEAKLSDEPYGVAVPLGDVRACRAVNEAIRVMYAEKVTDKLLRDWFSPVEFTPERNRLAPEDCTSSAG